MGYKAQPHPRGLGVVSYDVCRHGRRAVVITFEPPIENAEITSSNMTCVTEGNAGSFSEELLGTIKQCDPDREVDMALGWSWNGLQHQSYRWPVRSRDDPNRVLGARTTACR